MSVRTDMCSWRVYVNYLNNNWPVVVVLRGLFIIAWRCPWGLLRWRFNLSPRLIRDLSRFSDETTIFLDPFVAFAVHGNWFATWSAGFCSDRFEFYLELWSRWFVWIASRRWKIKRFRWVMIKKPFEEIRRSWAFVRSVCGFYVCRIVEEF